MIYVLALLVAGLWRECCGGKSDEDEEEDGEQKGEDEERDEESMAVSEKMTMKMNIRMKMSSSRLATCGMARTSEASRRCMTCGTHTMHAFLHEASAQTYGHIGKGMHRVGRGL